ncbi:MAG: hypothetical protein OXF02_06825 [Simkaniaceae bacterium]|nr:hypothetical protein [Simkaniaceae bacterium]
MMRKATKKYLWITTISVTLSAIATALFFIVHTTFDDLFRKIPPSGRSYTVTGTTPPPAEGWITFQPEKETFVLATPGVPECIVRELPLPRKQKTLLKEFRSSDGAITASISYVVLPSLLRGLHGDAVLKVAMKIVLRQHRDSVLIGQGKNLFKSLPALDYEYYFADREVMGTLILARDRIYGLEVNYPTSERKKASETFRRFIDSFEPELS